MIDRIDGIDGIDRYDVLMHGLYLALSEVLAGDRPTWELFQYESLVVPDLLCEPAIERLPGDVFRFRFDVRSLHSHLMLYSISNAPAAFARALVPDEREIRIARTRVNERWVLEPVDEPA